MTTSKPSKLKAWIDDNQKFIEQNGFIIFGRKRRLPNVESTDAGIRSHSVRSGLNFGSVCCCDLTSLAIDMGEYIKAKGMKSALH